MSARVECEQAPIAVLKFGGSVLKDHADVVRAREEIGTWRARGYRVVAVVSALEGTTDALVAQADRFATRTKGPDASAKAVLLATGELTSASLFGLELHRAGVRASVCTPWSIELKAEGHPLDAFPQSLDAKRLGTMLAASEVVVLPGFIGVDENARLVLLGRGGSDLSAIFVSICLNADRCRLIKDVDGLYECDPSHPDVRVGRMAPPRRFTRAHWNDALRLDGGIVQHKAVRFALEHRRVFEVGACGREDASIVGEDQAEYETASTTAVATAC